MSSSYIITSQLITGNLQLVRLWTHYITIGTIITTFISPLTSHTPTATRQISISSIIIVLDFNVLNISVDFGLKPSNISTTGMLNTPSYHKVLTVLIIVVTNTGSGNGIGHIVGAVCGIVVVLVIIVSVVAMFIYKKRTTGKL